MKLRRAALKDFKELYAIGRAMTELKVSNEEFMTPEDFKFAIRNTQGIFLVAEVTKRIVGFAYAVREGPTYAALVYVAIIPRYRKRGIASKLIERCEKHFRKLGVKSIYGLVTNVAAIKVMKSLGYRKGKKLVWIGKEL